MFFGAFLLLAQQSTAKSIESSVHSDVKKCFLPKDTVAATAHKPTITLSAKEARKLLRRIKKNKVYLIDVRTSDEFKSKHILYAQNIDYKASGFIEKMTALDQSKPLYLYCRSGHRSGKAADTLQILRNKQVVSIGALDSLIKIGFPIDNQ